MAYDAERRPSPPQPDMTVRTELWLTQPIQIEIKVTHGLGFLGRWVLGQMIVLMGVAIWALLHWAG